MKYMLKRCPVKETLFGREKSLLDVVGGAVDYKSGGAEVDQVDGGPKQSLL